MSTPITALNNVFSSNHLMSIETKREWIEEKIELIFLDQNKSELMSIDFEINVLLSAVQSYKHETVLKPFPSTFLSDSNNTSNHDQLLATLLSMPPVSQWRNKIKKFNKDQLSLVYWLLIHKNYQLESVASLNQVIRRSSF